MEARIKNHFTGSDGLLDDAHVAMAKKNAQLIKDMTSDDPNLQEIINVKVAAREAVVSNYDDLKAFVISMTRKKSPLGSSEKVRRIADGTPQYSGTRQFDNSPHFVQETSAWSSHPPLLTWS